MLFNSTIFLFVFLPLCGLGYWLILRFIGRYAAYAMLLLASLTFYAWWDIGNLLLLEFLAKHEFDKWCAAT